MCEKKSYVGIKDEVPESAEGTQGYWSFIDSLQVMVFIHGGALAIGGAFMFEGFALSAHENVIVVSIQYRLGITGFFR